MQTLSTKILENFTPVNEAYKNLFKEEDKLKYVDAVWKILNDSYSKVPGGLAGSGFGSKEEMIKAIPMWKLTVRNGEVVAVGMYKDKGGRKRIASGTNGTPQGKIDLIKSSVDDIKLGRTFVEISSAPLSVIKKHLDISKYAVSVSDVKKKLKGKKFGEVPENDPEVKKHPEFKEFFYSREIGGKQHTKLMIGNINSDPIIF